MAKDWAKSFYKSTAWKKCRKGYMTSQNYICERCGDIAVICHHKTWLNESNISNPEYSLAWDNLEALCQTCHNQEHHQTGITIQGLNFNSKGELIET